jgi:hypothetical protein
MTFDEAASVFVLVMAAALLGWRYRPRVFFGRLGATIKHLMRLFIMSPVGRNSPRATDTEAVHVPVRDTSTSARTTHAERDITDEWELPRISRRHSIEEIVIYLSVQKGPDGARYLFSANEIATLAKGTRAERLALIKAAREGPPAPQVREYQERLEQLAAAHED